VIAEARHLTASRCARAEYEGGEDGLTRSTSIGGRSIKTNLASDPSNSSIVLTGQRPMLIVPPETVVLTLYMCRE
jgi:hypothetical protein